MQTQPQVNFWKFVRHPVSTTPVDAAALAARIESGEVVPTNDCGERYYKLGGWCYDVGRMPFLIQYSYGTIERKWALSVKELRKACYLSRNDKVVPDPFVDEQSIPLAQAA